MYDIVTIGDVFEDVFLRPKDTYFKNSQIRVFKDKLCLEHGAKILVEEIDFDLGGSACNVAVGLKKFGYNTALISALGNDERGQRIKNKLYLTGIDTKYIKQFSKINSNFSSIIVYKKERTVLLYRGLKDYSQLKIPKNLSTRWVYLGPVSEEFSENYKYLINLAAEKNINIAINPGHRQILKEKQKLKNLIRVCKILILNKKEALDLTGLPPFTSIKKILSTLKIYGSDIVALTDGRNGAFITDGEKFIGCDILPTESIDPTGAGDAFSSGFIASYIKAGDLSKALNFGIINSGIVTEDYGAQRNLQTESQVRRLISKLPNIYNL